MSYQFHSDNLPAYRTEFDKLPNETSDEDLDQKLTILSLENCENEEVTLLPCGSQNEKYFCQFHVSTFQGQDLCRPAASTIFGVVARFAVQLLGHQQRDPPSLLPSSDVGVDEEWLCHYPLAGNPLQEALPAEAVWNKIRINRDNDSIFSNWDVSDSESCEVVIDRSPLRRRAKRGTPQGME
ncbi:hypothetical protein V8E54_004838 [Elaphomyces granulatus]